MSAELIPIGVIHSPYDTKEKAPIQGAFHPKGKAEVELFHKYEDGLKDIETFSHLILLYLFDRAGEIKLVRPTFLDDQPHGLFATRHPCRPNSIGLTIVKLLRKEKNILYVTGIDVLDQTPLIDIKPYITKFDCYPEADDGWVSHVKKRPKPTGRE